MRKSLIITLFSIAFLVSQAMTATILTRPDNSDLDKAKADLKIQRILENNPDLRTVNYTTHQSPLNNHRELLGHTWYDMQRNGSLNHLTAAISGDDGNPLYAVWTFWPEANSETRGIRYQYFDPTLGSWYEPTDEFVVNNGDHGDASLDVNSDGRAVVAHHLSSLTWVGLEGEPAMGAFTNRPVDEYGYPVVSSNLAPEGGMQHYFAKATGSTPGYWQGYDFDDGSIILDTAPAINLDGELMVIASEDGGQTWGTALGLGEPLNVSNTPDPGCAPGDCDNVRFATIAENVTDRIHFSYQVDTEPGITIQGQGAFTCNPVYYESVMIDDILPIPLENEVTFNVNMWIQECELYFNPETDTVVVRGSFNNWMGNDIVCTDPDGDDVYTAHAPLDLFPVGTVQYRYVIVSGDGDHWESIDNRTFEFNGVGINLPTVYFNNYLPNPTVPVDVRFVVDMSVQLLNGNFDPEGGDVVGPVGGIAELNNWAGGNPVVMGEIPDQTGKYGVIVRFDNYPLGTTTPFKFVIANDGSNMFWESSEDRTFTVTEGDLIDEDADGYYDLHYTPDDPAGIFFSGIDWGDAIPNDVTVTFSVDISSAIAYLTANPDSCLGPPQYPEYRICDPEDIDSVGVLGSFDGWPPPWPHPFPGHFMTDMGSDIWEIDLLFLAGDFRTFEYKFYLNGVDNEAGFAHNHVYSMSDDENQRLEICFGSQRTDIENWPDCDLYSGLAMEDDDNSSIFSANWLQQNYPNPFNPTTTISFLLRQPATVRLNVYNTSGQLAKTLATGFRDSGLHEVVWDGTNAAGLPVGSGIYFYRLQTDNGYAETKSMILLK